MIFEQPINRVHQITASQRLAQAWLCAIRNTPQADMLPWDYEFYRRSQLVAIGGYKHRNIRRHDFATYFLSLRHFADIYQTAIDKSVLALIVVEWKDQELGWVNAAKIRGGFIAPGGRHPRPGSTHDQELVFHIPIELFEMIR